jgi:hypothetical protein
MGPVDSEVKEMNRKVLAVLVIILTGAVFMTLGCAAKNHNSTTVPTQSPVTPAATPVSSPAATPSATSTPLSNTGGSITPTPGPGGNGSAVAGIDPSWLNVSGESDESLPENSIPTPDASDFS